MRPIRCGRFLVAVTAAVFLVSACATTSTTGAGAEGGAAPAQAAQPAPPAKGEERPVPGARPGAGYLSPLATAGYIPLKMIPCSLGAVGSLLGFFFTFDVNMVRDTFALNCGGDWIMTPDVLEGREPFRSVGRIEALPGPPPPPPAAPTGVAPPIREPGIE